MAAKKGAALCDVARRRRFSHRDLPHAAAVPLEHPCMAAPINLNALREDGKKTLVDLLDKSPGEKCLVLDPKLGGPLNHILATKTLKVQRAVATTTSPSPAQPLDQLTDCPAPALPGAWCSRFPGAVVGPVTDQS